jgi:hypothetical protein
MSFYYIKQNLVVFGVVCSVTEKHSRISDIRVKISVYMVDWINTDVRDQWQEHVTAAMNCGFAYSAGNFLTC